MDPRFSLEHARTNLFHDVLTAAVLQDHGIDAPPVQQVSSIRPAGPAPIPTPARQAAMDGGKFAGRCVGYTLSVKESR